MNHVALRATVQPPRSRMKRALWLPSSAVTLPSPPRNFGLESPYTAGAAYVFFSACASSHRTASMPSASKGTSVLVATLTRPRCRCVNFSPAASARCPPIFRCRSSNVVVVASALMRVSSLCTYFLRVSSSMGIISNASYVKITRSGDW